jgi:hypothetical protein
MVLNALLSFIHILLATNNIPRNNGSPQTLGT